MDTKAAFSLTDNKLKYTSESCRNIILEKDREAVLLRIFAEKWVMI